MLDDSLLDIAFNCLSFVKTLFSRCENSVFSLGKHCYPCFAFKVLSILCYQVIVEDGGRWWEMILKISHLENVRKQRVFGNKVAVWQINFKKINS